MRQERLFCSNSPQSVFLVDNFQLTAYLLITIFILNQTFEKK